MKMLFNKQTIIENKKYQYLIYSILFLILFIPNIFTLIYSTDLQGNFTMSISYLLLSLLVWFILLIFFNFKNFFRIGLLFILLSPLEIGFVKATGLPINIGLMETIFNTDFNEAKEQVFSNMTLLLGLLLLVIIYVFLLSYVDDKRLAKKWKIVLISVFLLSNSILMFSMFKLQDPMIPVKDRLLVAYDNTIRKYSKIYPANIIFNTVKAISTIQNNKKFAEEIENFTFNAKQISPNDNEELYILIIGETARRHNFHLYGYPRQTTPELEKINNLVPYTNVNSSATLTILSLPQIITRANPDNFALQFKEKTILDVFHEANFFTAWIGSQNMSTPLIKRLKSVYDYSFFQKSDVSSAPIYDGDILGNVKEIIADKSHRKKFLIIHTLGSHFRYSNRYPSNFEKFRPTISKSGYSSLGLSSKKELINSYDNSILYTDYFLASVIKEVKKANIIGGLIYLSDHGENLYEDNKTAYHGGEKPTRYEYEIPYLVWFSDQYRSTYPGKVENLLKNKDKIASSTVTFYSLSDMANIQYDDSAKEIKKSILHSTYEEPTQRKILTSKKEVSIID